MAITRVRITSASSDGSANTLGSTFAANGAGNLMVITVFYVDGGTISVTGVSDGVNTWHALTEVRNATQGYSQQMWYAYNISANAGTVTVTATFSGNTTFRRIHGAEYTDSAGAFSTDPFESPEGSGTGNGTSMATGSLTTAVANSVILTGGSNGSGNISAGSGYTLASPSGGGVSTGFAEHILSSTTTETAKLTSSVSGQWGQAAAKFKSVASPNATVTPTAVAAATTIAAPAVSAGSTVSPGAVAATTAIATPAITASSGSPSPAMVAASTMVPTPAVHGGAGVSAAVVSATTAIPTPLIGVIVEPPITMLIELAFGADPDSDLSTATWTDITALCRYESGITVRVGRHGFGSQTDPTSVAVSIDDRDGALTPFLNTGAHYPSVIRNLPIRVSAAIRGEVVAEQATAFIDSYRLAWDTSANDCVVRVTAQGRLSRLAKKAIKRSAATSSVVTTSPVAYWPLTDGTGATSAASGLSGGAPLTKSGSLKFGTGNGGTGLPKVLALGALKNTIGSISANIPAGTSLTSWRVEFRACWNSLTPTADATGHIAWGTSGTISGWRIDYDHANTRLNLVYTKADGSGAVSLATTKLRPYDGVSRSYRITADQNGTGIDVVLTIDGVSYLSTTIASQTMGRPTTTKLRSAFEFTSTYDGSQAPDVGGLTFWAPFAVTETVETDLAATGYVGELASDRVQRVCDELGIPVIVVPGDSVPMGVQPDDTAEKVLRECESADDGILHDNGPNGALVFIPRSALYNKPTGLTVDVDLSQLKPGFEPTYDTRDLVTSAKVSQPDGTSGSFSVDSAEGEAERSYTANVDDDQISLVQMAAWRVGRGTTPGMRYPKVAMNFRSNPELASAWADAGGVGGALDVTNLPQQHSPLPVEQIIEGYEMQISGQMWTVNPDCVPRAPFEVFVIGTSAATLVSSVDSDDTTFQTAVSHSPRWLAFTDGYLPLECGGETPIVATDIADVAITSVGSGAAAHANNTSVTPAIHASSATGDLMILVAAIRSTTANPDTPSGWTLSINAGNLRIFSKLHDGSESDPTVTFTGGVAGDTTSAAITTFRNTVSDVDSVFLDEFIKSYTNPSAQNVALPGLPEPPYDGCVVLYVGWKQDDWTSAGTLGGANRVDAPTTTGNDQAIVIDYTIQTTADAFDPGGFFTITGGASAISKSIVAVIAPGRSTLTVMRATNGTAISHSLGDAVTVANSGVLGL